MTEIFFAIVLLVIVAMMLGIVEVPGRRTSGQADPTPQEAKRARERTSNNAFRAQEMTRLRRQFRSRLQ